MAEWSWDPDDFAVLWLGDARDRLPRPIGYTSRLSSQDAVHYHRQAVYARYDTDQREEIELAFHTLTSADLRIEITGISKVLGKGTSKEYRIVGARNTYHAVMLTQAADPAAGETDSVEGTVRCRLFRTEQLAARLAAVVPSFPAGQGKSDTFHIQDLRDWPAESYTRNTPRDRFDRMAKHPIDGGGGGGLFTGSPSLNPDPWYSVQWVDIAGDGRYVQQRTREHLTVRPAALNDLTACYSTWIDHALRRLHDDTPAVW